MAVTVSDFRSQFPEFPEDSYSNAMIQRALAEARLIHNIRDLVTLYITAHILTVGAEIAAGTTGARGAVKKGKAGPMDVEYVSLAKDGDIKAELARTQYGARALLLESRTARTRIGAMVAG